MPSHLRPACRRVRLAAVLAAVLCAGIAAGHGQTAKPEELKAAFLLKFAKFTDWPADALAPESPIVFCVIDDRGVADALDRMVQGQTIAGRPLAVRRTTLQAGVRECHVLFAPGLVGARAREVVAALKDSATFSVSDTREFTRAGGVAHFFVDGDRMRFAINAEAADRARLQLSSRMLVLAKIVKDGHE